MENQTFPSNLEESTLKVVEISEYFMVCMVYERSTSDISKSMFIPNYKYFKINILVPENLL